MPKYLLKKAPRFSPQVIDDCFASIEEFLGRTASWNKVDLRLDTKFSKKFHFYNQLEIRGHSITKWTRWGRGQKMSVFVNAQGIKTVQAGGGGQKMANFYPRKGQLISKRKYEVVTLPKIWTKKFEKFCLKYSGQNFSNFFIYILGNGTTSYFHEELLKYLAISLRWLLWLYQE